MLVSACLSGQPNLLQLRMLQRNADNPRRTREISCLPILLLASGIAVSDNSELIEFLIGPGVDPAESAKYINSLQHAPLESVEMILRSLINNLEPIVANQPGVIDGLLRLLQSNLLRQSAEEAQQLDPDLIAALYENLPKDFGSRFLLLHALAIARMPEHLQALAELLVEDPPQNWIQVGLVLSPLFQHAGWDVDSMFPRVLDAIQNLGVAGGVLDLANHLFRSGQTKRHCCADRSDDLIPLLAALIAQLEQVEKNPKAFGDTPEQVNQVLSEAIALIVSVCDALALMGAERAVPQLQLAMELSHRRIQTEAAGALARLEQQEGIDRLIELAAEPSARLRVLAYAEELGLEDQIDETYQTAASRAESELALWLAQPGQMAVPPSHLELLDHRLQFWPGYDDPIDCFLFRFSYNFSQGDFSNLGIVGPMVHSFSADITELPLEDAYAAFAGWQAEHEDIYIVENAHWNPAQTRAADVMVKELEEKSFEAITPEFLGFFLGEYALVATAVREETIGICVFDGLELLWFPTAQRPRPMVGQDAWQIYMGRKILRTFNS